jgi:type I restriction enzyme M protein
MAAFEEALMPVGLLDRFQVTGTVAAWWDGIDYDMRSLANQGFEGLVDSWMASVRTAVDDEAPAGGRRNGADPMEHPLVEIPRLRTLPLRSSALRSE